MRELLFWAVVASLILSNALLILSIVRPDLRLWPPPDPPSGRHRYARVNAVLGPLTVVGSFALGVLDWNEGPLLECPWARALGAPLFAFGGAFALWGYLGLGVQPSQGHHQGLVASGAYRYSRNPQYVGTILCLLGYAWVCNSTLTLLVWLLWSAWFLMAPFAEEPWLRAHLGAPYDAYVARVPRFLGRRRRRNSVAVSVALLILGGASSQAAHAQGLQPTGVIFENVRIFDGTSDRLSAPSNVLVVGNVIEAISSAPIADPPSTSVMRLQGGGRTLMPGLIDAHTHIMFETLSQVAVLTSDIGFLNVAAVKAANDMLMRGFTSIRDLGGPVFGLKRGIDLGLVPGPRIWPSGAFISQSGGHGDFRLPNDLPARPGDFTFSERVGAAAIADTPDAVRLRVREQLALGASQVKLMAGGGVASSYDPLDVTQYTVPELRAAVEAAENWGTYVTVHAYTPRAVRQAIEAGVQCIDHGQLLDEPTARLMAEKGTWWSLQPFTDDGNSPFPEGSPNRAKQLQMFGGTDAAYALAKKFEIKTAWGTDILFSAEAAAGQGAALAKMIRWYTPAEALRMATAGNAELLALSGLRSPYAGKLGVVQEGALADLLLVDGDPLTTIDLIADPSKNFVLIMKDGRIFKNLLD